MFKAGGWFGKLVIITFTCASFCASAQTITNGSLTGPVANAGVPTGWSSLQESPDTNDETHAAGLAIGPSITWDATPSGPSPDGGTWVGVAASDTGFQERFGQTVTGLTVGVEYELSWYAANFGAILSGGAETYSSANDVEVLLDGSSIGTGGTLSLDPAWSSQSINFVATATSHEIAFQPASLVFSYIQVDGIALAPATAPPPPPPAPTPPEQIPVMSVFGLLITALGVMLVALTRLRRRL